jgi:hypothetical protein
MSRTKCHLFKNQYITCDYRRVLVLKLSDSYVKTASNSWFNDGEGDAVGNPVAFD